MQDSRNVLDEVTKGDYKYGFVTDIDTDVIHRGLDEETIRLISAKKQEPEGKETRTGVVVGFSPQGFPLLANLGDARLGAPQDSTYRLPGYYLLCRP